jgi:hypothetical protein
MLVTSKGLVDLIAFYIHGFKICKDVDNDRPFVQSLLGLTIETILDFKDREMYDMLSMNLIKANTFELLIKGILKSKIVQSQFKNCARIFELCACHLEGIKVLSAHLNQIVY